MADHTKYDDLSALFINCSLKRSTDDSHTLRLINRAAGIMREQGVAVEIVHALEHNIPAGMEMDLNSEGVKDDWPEIQKKIMAADILVLGSPIWLGVKASVATLVIERMYSYSGERNEKGQYLYYGKTAGVLVTGNEDGAKAVAMDVLYAMSHIGYMVPPQADAAWLGEAGPGPSYGDTEWNGESLGETPMGYDNDFTNRNTTFMAWNLMHTARMLKDQDGMPSHGNQPSEWQHVTNAKDQNPEYR